MDFPNIANDPEVCAGKPHVRGTRLTVEFIRGLVEAGWKREDVLEVYPYLKPADLEACLLYPPRS